MGRFGYEMLAGRVRRPVEGSDAQQPADARGVHLGDFLGTVEATGAAGGLALQVVALSRPGVGEPAGAGDLDPLLRTGMRLVLRHGFFAHNRCWWCWIAVCRTSLFCVWTLLIRAGRAYLPAPRDEPDSQQHRAHPVGPVWSTAYRGAPEEPAGSHPPNAPLNNSRLGN